jgi:hypothetical protein
MEFQVRQSSSFVMNIILVFLAVFMAAVSVVFFRHSTNFLRYSFVIWLIFAFVRGLNYWKYLILSLRGKPVIIINETYIADEANQIRYYWNDIVGFTEQNLYLYIKLKDPNTYLKGINNPLQRFLIGASGPQFRINLDLVKCDPDVLIELIEETNAKGQ